MELKHQRGEVQAIAKGLAWQQQYVAKVNRKLEVLQSKQTTTDDNNKSQV